MQKHRISTNLGTDQKITVELKQDFDVLEILSLKFTQQEVYTSICSDYGVVCGRVTANNGFGLGNARVSIFIPLSTEDEDDPVISKLYPYREVTDKDDNNYRYNLLPSRQQHGGHAATGTFPDQSDILSREEVLEVYEKYYKFTVKTNPAGDFMIWGVPVGNQTIHVDVDLSDIGCFSLRPYDLQRLGIGVDGFKNKYTFKSSEDLDSLPQIVSFDKLIEVYPFWGNEELCEIGITRTDFDLSERGVNIKPTAYLIGGVFGDSAKNSVNKNCTPRRKMGRKCDLVTKSANIEALRFKPVKDDLGRPFLEYLSIDEDVPDDGGFVLPLEMNMDYVITNEFGENEYTNDFNKGIATSACYRFRFNLNDSGLDRARANADFLVPNIREYDNDIDKSYYFGLDYSGYPADAQSLILNNENGQFKPKDYFYRFNYNKVYTVSSFHSHFIGQDALSRIFTSTFNPNTKYNFANINEILPSEEEDCSEKVTPPTNFGVKNYTFSLLIADFLLALDFVIKFLTLQFLNFTVWILNTAIEVLISVTSSGRGLRENLSEFQINNTTKLSLINYPECVECSDETATTGGGDNSNGVFSGETGCDLYDTLYDDSLVTGYFIVDNTNTNLFDGCGDPASYLPANKGRRYVPTLSGLTNYTLISTAIYGSGSNVPASDPIHQPNGGVGGDYGPLTSGVKDLSCQSWGYKGGPITPSGRSEFKNGVFYIVPGTQTTSRLTGLLREYFRRKRVGKMFCGGIVNYGFIDNWLSGSLYFTQFKVKKLRKIATATSEGVLKYCRSLVRFVFDQKRFYYRSASFNTTTGFDKEELNRPTTIVDLGPRDEFIKEICIDKTLDPNCSVARSIGPTSQQSLGDLLGLAINYRMDTANANGNLDLFFSNQSFFSAGLYRVLDGDILQLVSINNEAGIDQFDLENSKYLGYRFDFLDPENNESFFKVGNDWGPLPVTLELDEDGQRIRSCLNDRLNDSTQEVPFYLWEKGGEGFGPGGVNRSNQGWDYNYVITKPLQGMTYGYNLTASPNDPSDKFLLLPTTNTNPGVTGNTSVNITDVIEYDIVYSGASTGYTQYDIQYPGFSVLRVTGGTIENPTAGTLHIRYGSAGTWQTIPWSSTTDLIIPQRQDYYSGTTKQILSTPFQFYFGLNVGKTGLDKFIDLFGPNGAFNLLECEITPPEPTNTPTPTPTPTPTSTPTVTPTPTPTLNPSGLNLMSGVKSGVTLNLLCSGGGSSVNVYFSGTSIQLGEILYSNNTLPNPTPVINGRYYYPTYETIYVVTGGLGSVTSTEFCPTPTPLEYTIENIWTSDALTSNPTEQDLTFAIPVACDGTSSINSSSGLNGPATMTGWGNNICNALRLYNAQSLILSEVTNTGNIILRQTLNNFDGSGGNKKWYRRYQRVSGEDYFLPIGGCSECGVEPPTPTPIPLVTATIYAKQGVPYDAVENNIQLIYSKSTDTTNIVAGPIQKNTTEIGTYVTSISMEAGTNLNLGAFLRITSDGTCDYVNLTLVNVFADDVFSNERFTSTTGTLFTETNAGGTQGTLLGASFSISQNVDIYLTTNGLPLGFMGAPPLTCLTSNE